jgi:hypothetical protein
VAGYVVLTLFCLLIVVWLVLKTVKHTRRKKLLTTPIRGEWLAILNSNVSLYGLLPEKLKQELQGLINVFLNEKVFFGYEGLKITDEIRVTIAAHACILLLNRKSNCYPRLKTIMVYPSAYVAKEIVYDGPLQSTVNRVRSGESWHRGPVILSWDDAKRGAFEAGDGQNVILHEFAHQLDQENGSSDGLPVLAQRSQYVTWARILGYEYEQLKLKVASGEPSLIDQYGATTPAEFFAVVSETFFERPQELKRDHPELYDEFRKFYQLDPIDWS